MIYDAEVLVVGSGPAGAAAALQLAKSTRPLLIDVGRMGPSPNASATPEVETFGKDFEGLSHITGPYLSPKLRSPLFRYVTRDWRTLSPIESTSFRGELSLALGGLANAWGSGLYEFDSVDLKSFPISVSDLRPYYDELTNHIGISGGDECFGDSPETRERLLPPLPLAGTPAVLYQRAEDPSRKSFLRDKGIRIGRQRLGVLTRPHRGRAPYLFDGRDFFRPGKPSIYHPGYTVKELEKNRQIEYRSGLVVQRFEEAEDGIVIHAIERDTGHAVTLSGRVLLLGAGAINSARIALQSYQEYGLRLPLLENPVSFIPCVEASGLGRPLDRDSFTGAQLAVIYDGPAHPDPVQGSFYNLAGILEADFFFDFPFSVRGNCFCLAQVLGAMGVLQLFYSDKPSEESYLALSPNGRLEAHYAQRRYGAVERILIASLRRLGFWSYPFLVRPGEPGGSFHYAGTLPMGGTSDFRGLATDVTGRLQRSRRVYAIDAATFPFLPAKNLSLTIMANAMRIAAGIRV